METKFCMQIQELVFILIHSLSNNWELSDW